MKRARDFLFRFLKRKTAVAGLVIFAADIIAAVFAPFISLGIDPYAQEFASLSAPSLGHLFGTDQLGRDVYSRVIFGTRTSMEVGLASVFIAISIASIIGLTSGSYAGKLDGVLMRIIDIWLSFPGILLALMIISIANAGLSNLVIAVAMVNVPLLTRVIRSTALSLRERDYVEASKMMGANNVFIIRHHIFPNAVPLTMVLATTTLPFSIILAASLSYLGLGVQPPLPDWGYMLFEGQSFLSTSWWLAVFPGLAILVTALGINLLGDGLRDALDPSLRL